MHADEELRLQLPAVAANVRRARHAAGDFAQSSGASPAKRADIELAVSEACTNAVLHAFVGRRPGIFELTGWAAADVLVLCIADDGTGMRTRSDSPGAGLGRLVLDRTADTVEYSAAPSGGTLVRLSFALTLRAVDP